MIILTAWFFYQNTTLLKFSAALAGNIIHLICTYFTKHEVWQALGDSMSGSTPLL